MFRTSRISTKKLTPLFVALLFFITQVVSTAAIALLNMPSAHAANDISVSTHQGQLSPSGTYSSGNITEYTENDSINFRFDVDSSTAVSGQMQIEFTSNDTGCLFFDGTVNLGTHDGSATVTTNVTGVAPVVSLAGPATNDGSDWVQIFKC